jgi:hypothetical protein
VLRSLSALGSAHVVVLQLSRLLRSFVGLGGPDEWRSLPGQDRCRSRRRGDGGCGGAGLERLAAGEDVPAGDQDLPRNGGLGGVALAVALLGIGVEPVPGVVGSPRVLGGLDGGPAQGIWRRVASAGQSRTVRLRRRRDNGKRYSISATIRHQASGSARLIPRAGPGPPSTISPTATPFTSSWSRRAARSSAQS